MALRAGTVFHGTVGQPTAQVIDGSLRFNGVNQHLTKTFGSGNRRTFTLSYWIKEHGKGSSPTNNPHILWSGTGVETRGGMVHRGTAGDDAGRIYMFNQVSNSTNSAVWTDSKHRDFSAWKHVVFKVDSTQGTGTNRVKIYINGVEQDDEYKTTPTQNLDFQININQEHRIGRGTPDDYGNFSLSQYYFIDGQALGPEYFAFTDPLTNTWRPKKYTGTFTGTNTFYLPFDGNSPIGQDKSGNGNDWTTQNFSNTSVDPDILKDSPSGAVFGGRGQTGITTTSSAPANYCTLNPIDGYVSTKDGNLETATSSGWQSIRATLGMKSGKFYWETQNNQTAAAILGIADTQATGFVDGAIFGSTGHGGGDANPAWTWAGANYYFNATSAASGSLANHTSSDIVQYAFDADSGNLWFGRNGTWYSSSWATTGDPANGVNPTVSGIDTTKTYVACGSFYNGSGKFNFGQRPFKYAPPQGFLPLNSASARPNTVISRPDQYVGITTWKGDGNTGRQIRTLSFSPDLVWIKQSSASRAHAWFDTVRGANKRLQSSTTNGETTHTDQMSAFLSNGFTVEDNNTVNVSDGIYRGFCWKAGGSKNTFNIDDVGYSSAAAAGLDGGSINPTGASIGTKQGFSIIGYTGTDNASDTFAHGLSQKPDFALFKNRSQDGDDWITYNSTPSLGATKRVKFNTADGSDSQTSQFNDTEPTSSLFTIGTYDNINKLNNNYIAYIWHNVPGLQKFGEFLGDGGSGDDGPFVETGFRPALIWLRPFAGSGIANNGGWYIWDVQNDSNPYNDDVAVNQPGNYFNYGNLNNGMDSHAMGGIDILSNGFKLRRDTAGYSNYDGWTFIYCAFADTPASNLFGGQSNAR